MTRFSFMRLSVWSWPHVSLRPGKYVSMHFAYAGPFALLIRVYHTPYEEAE